MFIKPLSYYIHNVRSRTFGRTVENSKSGRKKRRTTEYRCRRFQESSSASNNTRRFEKDSGELCIKDKQYQFYPQTSRKGQAWSKTKSVILSIPFFFIYNPQVLFTLIYIDSMFTDELISFNMVQLNSIFSNIQTFINTGVV